MQHAGALAPEPIGGEGRTAGAAVRAALSASGWSRRASAFADGMSFFVIWAVSLTAAFGIAALAAREAWDSMAVELLFMMPVLGGALLHLALRRLLVRGSGLEQRLGALRLELAAFAHDVRGPLMTTRSYLELLNAGALGPLPVEARDIAGRAVVATAQAQTLAQSLRRLAADDAARPLAARPVELRALVGDVMTALDAQVQLADAIVEIGELPAVIGDRDALYRVFANLVENAVKYRAQGRAAQIRIGGTREGDTVRIAVRDWGIGVPPDERERIFTLRARGKGVGARDGSGIGLATVRRLVELQGGRVWVDPTVTDGSCFQVALPAAD